MRFSITKNIQRLENIRRSSVPSLKNFLYLCYRHGNILKGAMPRGYKVIALIRYYAQNALLLCIYNEDTTQIS